MLRLPLYLCVMVLVSSCGGGKDESSPVEISNRAPVITDPGVLSVREGVSDVVSLSGTDADGNSLTFEIVSGDDQSLFTITSAGNLRFVIAPDFEAPSDANTDNKYLVNVELTDGTLTDSVSLVVSVTDAFEGRVVDAPISGASVFIDLNGNNQLDADEPSGTTDTSGYFQVDSFSLPIVGDAKVVSMGGLDIKTGKALTDLALVSDVPTDKTQPVNVTPLTTVISAATTPEEKAQVLSAFGISGSVEELLTSDGWAKAESGDENAKANQRINQQIGLLLQTAITLTDDADESTDVSVALAQSVAKQISVVAQSEGSIDLTASTTIKTVLTDAAQEITPSIDVASSVVKAVADAVAMVNAVVANITLDPLSDMATEIVVAAQGSLQASVLDVVSGSVTVDSFAEEAGAVKLFENIAVAADAPDSDSDGIPDMLDFDDDNDGVADGSDAFPLDSTESIDIDGDGIGNNADSDDDNDGVADDADTFPLDSTESIDTDGDGIGNNADTDDDGDGVADALDVFPLDETETIDTDGDGIGNNADSDNDGDGVADDSDAFPLDSTESIDTDGDGIGNNIDSDDDNDGVADGSDAFPLDSTESIDTDSDGIGNNADSDDDNDGVADDADTFPLDSTESIDTDVDGIGNNADTDDDGDGVADALDAFPLDETETIDTDGDGIGNNIDSDDDNDGVADGADAFPLDETETIDTDGDGIGNNADSDNDGDGVADDLDAFPLDETETIDTDGDGIGNNADSDNDGDGVADDLDPEPLDNTKTPPLAIIDTDISTGDAPLRVAFNSNSSIAGNPEDITDSIISTTWNSGDGTAGSGSTFEHIYHSEGDYIVSLTVTNSDGYSHVETYPIKVTSNNSLISISGSISIPSTYVVDSDVNDQDTTPQSNDLFFSAQEISRSSVVSGYVNQPLFGELGNSWLLGDIKDVYKVNALGGEVINLIVGNKNLGDLDIRISHWDGTYIDFSVGDSTLYESITLPDVSETYFIVVEAFSGASNYLLEIGGSKSLAMHGWNNEVEIADNELLVKENKNYSMTSIRQTQKTMGVQKVDTIHATDYSGPVLYKLDTSTFLSSSIKSGQSPRSASWMPFSSPKYETLLKAKELKALNHFEYVEPNFIRKQSALPNDPLYPFQSWHYEQINLPEAWDRSTGMGNVKVAVIDTGVVLDHPDLVHRVTNDGYDFISSVFSSGDGDGVDSDASDPGNGRDNAECMWSERQSSSFHGTHVAGTVGATGNDSFGLTGVNWNVDIMPIRVLGCDGGDNYDIAQAIYYAAGLPNAYGLSPNSPADIINLSLGSSYSSYFERAAIQAAIDSGVIVIAAAGNEAMDGNPLSYPASYPGVISVGAVNPEGNRAWYSNFNYAVDIVAPGGYDHSNPFSTTPGMIYSTSANITNGNILPSFKWSVGTSMAAPHVAGVVSLMKGIYPSLTPKDLDDALSLGLMTVDIGALGQDSEYGFGLIDANKALQTAEGFVSGVNTNFPPLLNLTAYEIDLGVTAMEFTVQAYNAGGGRISITDVVASSQNISISAPSSEDGLGEYTVSLDRNNLSQGVYTESIQFSSDYGSRLLTLYFEELASNAEQPDGGKIYILLYNLISDDPIKQVSSVAVSGQYSFTIEDINPDVYYLVTGSDIDNDGFICGPAEACAYWPSREQEDLIVANKSFDNIDMVLRFEAQVSASSQALSTVNSSKALKIKSNCEKEIDVNRSDKVRIYPCVEQHLRDLK
jgi:subtilisin family serine protease